MPPRTRAKGETSKPKTTSKANGKAKPTSTGTKTTKRTTGKKCKAKRLKKMEVQSICSNLRDVDIELRADLARQINSGYHL